VRLWLQIQPQKTGALPSLSFHHRYQHAANDLLAGLHAFPSPRSSSVIRLAGSGGTGSAGCTRSGAHGSRHQHPGQLWPLQHGQIYAISIRAATTVATVWYRSTKLQVLIRCRFFGACLGPG
jgi:hypothetical protein